MKSVMKRDYKCIYKLTLKCSDDSTFWTSTLSGIMKTAAFLKLDGSILRRKGGKYLLKWVYYKELITGTDTDDDTL
jgi:hypothetical protein